MTRRLLPRIAGGVLIALLLPVGVAWAAPSADIVGLTSDGDQLRAVVEVADIEPGTEPDPGSVTMSVNGADVPAEATLAADQVQIDQVAILVLDTSRSMTGDKILDAKAAAVGFLDQVPDAVRVGLVTFDSQTRIRVEPTTDHRTVADTVQGLEVSTEGATTLYDAVILTSDQFGSADVGTAVVLSDGADRGSQSTVEEAARAAKRSGAVFDSVAFGGNGAQVAALNQISSATGGTVSDAANADQLAAVFDAAATDIANRYVVVGTLPADLTTGSATVEVSMAVGGVPVRDSATVPLDPSNRDGNPDQYAPTPVPPPSSLATFVQDNIWAALAGIFVALLILVFVATSAARSGGTSGGSRMRRSLSV
ncbi:MAG TPA: VWA domain-containing protein, partial [Actinomycetes bacterium]|nr:VWA domain-containing protein [Actinomycetes bacterium]